jgi:hypothetical protein
MAVVTDFGFQYPVEIRVRNEIRGLSVADCMEMDFD